MCRIEVFFLGSICKNQNILTSLQPDKTIIGHGDVAQLARALAWHARGRGFESHLLHQKAPHWRGFLFY
jgi:hypothetical protein